MKGLGIKILVVEAVLASALWIGVYSAAHACDVSSAKASTQEASDYARRAKSAAESGDVEDAFTYARRAENSANDASSYLSDCEDQD